MKYKYNNLKINIEEMKKDNYIDSVKEKLSSQINIPIGELFDFKIEKQSVDARKRNSLFLVYNLSFSVENKKIKHKNLGEYTQKKYKYPNVGENQLSMPPIIVGSGPSGLFAAYILAKQGYKPIVLERGDTVENRTKSIKAFNSKGSLDVNSNIQFGEGGAGTFSDGKLTTGINDNRCRLVLKTLKEFGAPEEIMYLSKPHIGTDKLREIIIKMRKSIIKMGGEFRFRTCLNDIEIKNEELKSIKVNGKETIMTNVLILAIGHSARDTMEMLYNKNVKMISKPFSVGFRIEHPQAMINEIQYGKYANHPMLDAADYKLFQKVGDRTVYSFCMCPGGYVVGAASEENMVVTNGMSEYNRDGANANSALVVSVNPSDYESNHPLAGIAFQRNMEKKAFEIAGCNYAAPIQRLDDFINNRVTTSLGSVKSSFTGEVVLSNLNGCVPDFISNAMKSALPLLNRKLNGFVFSDALLTGVETRTSSPLRILRNESFQSETIKGLYPTGEGAGYAGGIMSAAVDGIRIAEQIIKIYKPF